LSIKKLRHHLKIKLIVATTNSLEQKLMYLYPLLVE